MTLLIMLFVETRILDDLYWVSPLKWQKPSHSLHSFCSEVWQALTATKQSCEQCCRVAPLYFFKADEMIYTNRCHTRVYKCMWKSLRAALPCSALVYRVTFLRIVCSVELDSALFLANSVESAACGSLPDVTLTTHFHPVSLLCVAVPPAHRVAMMPWAFS